LLKSGLYCQIFGDPYCLHLQEKPSKCIKGTTQRKSGTPKQKGGWTEDPILG
jgi:hypothetical protein